MPNCECAPHYESEDLEKECVLSYFIKSKIYGENDFDYAFEIWSIIILLIIIIDFVVNIISNYYQFTKVFRL